MIMDMLTNPGDTAKLAVADAKEIRVSLTWKRPGFLGRIMSGAVDLDLGCFYRLRSGRKNLIDCLQFGNAGGPADTPTRQGCLVAEPWIWHTGDAPGEKQSNEEALIINPAGLSDIESVMIYCYIFDGPAMWDKIDAKLTIRAGNVIEIPITPAADSRFIALAEITPDLCVKLLGTSHKGHADCDATYNWDFDYN